MEQVAKDDNEILQNDFKDGDFEGPDVLKYGSNPDKQYYYMCPRYWCLLTNKPLTEAQLKAGECGGKDAIIPRNVKKVPKGKSIYQFYNDDEKRYPGFHKEHTPNGQCIPCCYDNWNKPAQINRRAKCSGDSKEDEEKIEEVDNYVKGPEKFPLNDRRWGYLPFAIQTFFNESNGNCQISKLNTNIKPFYTCLLRHGVEHNVNQSFIACIASVLFYGDKDETTKNARITKFIPDAKYDVPSISVMKQLILDAINIDLFITYQNGDLVTSFANDELKVDETIYYDSNLWTNIKNNNANTHDFFSKVVKAFENFKLFLENPTVVIDYTYLWDIICKPNAKIFEHGLNLIILEILDNDITNNVELVCPTNHYSNNIYDAKKRTLILIKHNKYFEPIYSYRNEEKRILIVKTFSEYDTHLPAPLRILFRKIIKPILKEKCKPFPSMSNVYRFKTPPLLDDLLIDLKKRDYDVDKQVLNFQGKVIGVLCKDKKGQQGFIQCFPSSLTSMHYKCNIVYCYYDFVYMTDNIWQSYETTISFLKEYYKYNEPDTDTDLDKSQEKCKDGTDICKVIEDKMIVGFLTQTNQFVQISPPIPESNISDNIRQITNNNYLIADIETQANTKQDSKRIDYIKRIELETQFFNIFRNTIRILLSDYINSDKRKEIQELCDKKLIIYNTQLEEVIKLLKNLCNGYVVFAELKGNAYKDITACISLSKDKCIKKNPICMFTEDKCSIVLPKYNLLSNKDNEEYYYGKMADELIRYNRIKSFIFKPQSYLSFGQLKYNLKEDEIIILQTLLNNEYFEHLVPSDINNYAKYNTFDTAEPITSQAYSNEVILNDNKVNDVRNCFPSTPTKITSKLWQNCFPSNYKEIKYDIDYNTNKCIRKIILFYQKNKYYELELNKTITLYDNSKLIFQEKQKLDEMKTMLIKIFNNKSSKFKFHTLFIFTRFSKQRRESKS